MTELYSQLTHDQLLSAITERDEQLRVALGERDEWERKFMASESNEVQSLKSQLRASQERCKELEDELDAAGIRLVGFEGLLSTHKTVLKECVSALRRWSEAPSEGANEQAFKAITHATALLEGSKGEV